MIGRHLVTFQDPGKPEPDGVGGFRETWTDLVPAHWYVDITPATAADRERFTAGTVVSTATVMVRGRYHGGVSTATRMLFNGCTYAITGKKNVDERSIDMELAAVETVTPA